MSDDDTDSTAATETPYTAGRQSTAMRLGWIVLGLLILGLVIGGGAMLVEHVADRNQSVAGRPTTAEIAGGGGAFTVAPPVPTIPPIRPPRDIGVAGVGKEEKYACDATIVGISGVDNTVTLTGHCAQVAISGVGNKVVIEESDVIVVSGMNNVVTYRTGSPELNRSGMNNTVERG